MTVSLWKFSTAFEAEHAELTLKRLLEQDAIVVNDAVFLSWPHGDPSPRSRPLKHDRLRGGAGGATLGVLLGAALTVPVVGLALGAAAGVRRARKKAHLNPAFADRLRENVQPGTSAVLLLSDEATVERIRPEFEARGGVLVHAGPEEVDAPAG